MARKSARGGATTTSRRAAPEPARPSGKANGAAGSRASSRQSRRSGSEPSGRQSRRSKATRAVKPVGNSTAVLSIAAGVGLLVLVIAVVAWASSSDNTGPVRKGPAQPMQDNTPQYWEKMGDDLVSQGGDRAHAADYLSRAADMYDDQGESDKASLIRAKAYGLRNKDAHLDFYNNPPK